jgi:hypothetical protein
MSVHHVILFDSWPHLSALMPPARPPGCCHRGSGIDRALPARARVAAPWRPCRCAHRGGRRAGAPSSAGTSPSTSRGWRHPRPHACVRSSACADDGSARMHNRHPRLPEHQQPRLHCPLSHPPAPPVSAPRRSRRSPCSLPGRRHRPSILARPRITATARTRITDTNVRGHPTSRRRCAFPTSPPPFLPPPLPLPLPLLPSPSLSLTADSDDPVGLFASTVLRRSVRECLLHQHFRRYIISDNHENRVYVD